MLPSSIQWIRLLNPKDNTMSYKLDLTWSAHFKDGTAIHQFDDVEQTKEHRFGEVQEKEQTCPLEKFLLFNSKTNTSYWVDLERGRIFIEPAKCGVKATHIWTRFKEKETEGDTTQKYRLINFRRVTCSLSWNPLKGETESKPTGIAYFVGFQYTTQDGRNIKKMLQISQDDEVCIV